MILKEARTVLETKPLGARVSLNAYVSLQIQQLHSRLVCRLGRLHVSRPIAMCDDLCTYVHARESHELKTQSRLRDTLAPKTLSCQQYYLRTVYA